MESLSTLHGRSLHQGSKAAAPKYEVVMLHKQDDRDRVGSLT